MTIKTLLLGSAAALMAVTGAQAADAVIIEAEPVEYVRVCDAYGAGYFYIPGTETCLKISGYVRIDYSANHYHDEWNDSTVIGYINPTDRHSWGYKGQVAFNAKNETEWGTLSSVLVLNGSSAGKGDEFSKADGPSNAGIAIDQALISLAGFRLGFSDDYWSSHGGYGYYSAISSGNYNYGQALLLDYTYAADGFTATVGIQDGRSGTAGQPDLYVGADYSGSWGRIWGMYYHDSSYTASVGVTGSVAGNGNGAWKAGAELSLSDYIPGGRIKGWYMSDDGDTDYVKGHAWGITAKMDLTDSIHAFAGYSDYDYSTQAGTVYDRETNDTSNTHWTAGLKWQAAPGLQVTTEYTKRNYDYQIINNRLSTGTYNIRVHRSF